MTKNRRAKKAARSRMEQTGESYSTARRATLAPDTTHFPDGLAFVDDYCANCMMPLPEERDGLFCSSWCQETTKHVRYFRRVYRDGRIDDPDVQTAVRVRLAFLPRGGYVALSRNLSPQTRRTVKERADGQCERCGAPGVDVDHIAGDSPDLDNLQLLCRSCHTEKTAADLSAAPHRIRVLVAQLMAERVRPATPRLLADDDDAWPSQWRGLKAARRRRLLDELDELGIDSAELTGRAEMAAARDEMRDESRWSYDDDAVAADTDNFDGGYGADSYFTRAMNED